MAPDNEDLVNLIARCAIRDQHALKLIYDKVGPFLNRVAFKILGSQELSNEVLQEAFVQLWNNAGQYRANVAKPLTWMTSIVRYRAFDRLRHEKRHLDNINTEMPVEQVLATVSSDDPERQAIHAEEQQHMLSCLATLNERISDSFKLAYLYGFSREDIAIKFDTNTNTVKSWLRRGVERLKRCIEDKITLSH